MNKEIYELRDNSVRLTKQADGCAGCKYYDHTQGRTSHLDICLYLSNKKVLLDDLVACEYWENDTIPLTRGR